MHLVIIKINLEKLDIIVLNSIKLYARILLMVEIQKLWSIITYLLFNYSCLCSLHSHLLASFLYTADCPVALRFQKHANTSVCPLVQACPQKIVQRPCMRVIWFNHKNMHSYLYYHDYYACYYLHQMNINFYFEENVSNSWISSNNAEYWIINFELLNLNYA